MLFRRDNNGRRKLTNRIVVSLSLDTLSRLRQLNLKT